MTCPVDTLKALRIGVEMDAAHDPEGPAKLAAIDAAIAALDGWRPIATAPRDTVIDLWHPEYGRMADQWWDSGDGFDWPVAGATHWMPKPAGPTGDGSAQA